MGTIPEEVEKTGKEKEQAEKENSKKENLSPRRLLSRQPISPAKVSGICLTEEYEKNLKPKLPPQRQGPATTPIPEAPKPEQEARPAKISALRPRTPSPVCQDHGRAGQEMCYLCMQRAQRNIPVYFGEDKRRKEEEEDRILAQYQALKDHEAYQKQLMRLVTNREENQRIAAFNLGVAEAARNHKNEKSSESYKSYIFEKRPTSATLHQKQEVYAQQLGKQVDDKMARELKLKQDQDLIDRLEQVQLAEELAAQRTRYLKDKMEETKCYKRALDTQIKMRPAPLPPYEPDSAGVIFGKNDMTNERMEEIRKRYQEYSRCQLQAAADRKRADILRELIDQRRAADMLQRAKEQLMAEKGERLEKIFQMNLAVQDDWKKSAGMKRQRDYEEQIFRRAGDKLLLLDQCARYRRCYQCKRRVSNCGETNVLEDSKYIPGSRLIV